MPRDGTPQPAECASPTRKGRRNPHWRRVASRRRPSRWRAWLGLILAAAAWRGLEAVSLEVARAATPGMPSGAAAAASPAGNAVEVTEVQAALTTLRDGQADPAARRRAAEAILARLGGKAAEVLHDDLRPAGDPGLHRAVAQALVERAADPPPEFEPILVALLQAPSGNGMSDLAAAAGRCPGLTRRLSELAGDGSLPPDRRRGAIIALGHYRTQAAARSLMQLIQPDQPASLRGEAFASLARLSGTQGFGADLVRWQQWWDQHRVMSEGKWLAAILENQSRKMDRVGDDAQRMRVRLVELQRQVYRATPQEERPERLVRMLGDPIEAIRGLAVELVFDRISERLPIGPELRAALRESLDDPSPAVRQGAARRLGEIADEAGAEAVMRRLLTAGDTDADVLRAYLSVMARVPRREAVDAAIQLLEDPLVRREAAAALSRSLSAGLVDEGQRRRAGERVRQVLPADGGAPDAAVIDLLGRLADAGDWARIHKWLDARDTTVRVAAAKAWANDAKQPLGELARRADDPDVYPILLEAAERRGNDRETLYRLVKRKPESEQAVLAWQRALLAMVERVAPEAVVEADEMLRLRHEQPELRNQMVSMVIARLTPPTAPAPPATTGLAVAPGNGVKVTATAPAHTMPASEPAVVIKLLLIRADIRLAQGEPNQAMADLRRAGVDPAALPPALRDRYHMLTFLASLGLNDADGAFAAARLALAVAPAALEARRHSIVAAYIDAARRSLTTGQIEPARRALAHLRELVGDDLPVTPRAQVEEMERFITQATAPAADATSMSPTTAPGSVSPAPGRPAASQPAPPLSKPAPTTQGVR